MIKTTVWLVAFPDEQCLIERVDLRILMQRAIRIEARMSKGVNLADEQGRYHTLCDRIEYYGHMIALSGNADLCELGEDYLSSLHLLHQKDPETVRQARLTADFCPSQMVSIQIASLTELMQRFGLLNLALQQKIAFYQSAAEKGWHVVELQQVVSDGVYQTTSSSDLRQEFLSLKIKDEITIGLDANAYVGLRNQIRDVVSAVEKGIPAAVNFSDLGHHVITEILNEFVYSRGRKFLVPVTYSDGSQAAPFPIYCLRRKDAGTLEFAFKDTPIIKVGMMSQRHPEMDPRMKIYFFRNQEISTGGTAAEIDTLAYRQAKELLKKMRSEGKFSLAFYQTGFQPVIVGFYRALTEELIDRSYSLPSLQVIPYYYLHEEYRVGKIWV